MALKIERLTLSLGPRRVLDDVSAVLQPGRVTAILGPNGSGKTSLVKAMAGLLPAEKGSVSLDGRGIGTIASHERARMIGYLPQDGAVHWGVTVESLVALGRLPHRAPFAGMSAADWDAVTEAMIATDTAQFAGRLVTELSGGERARVLLARVLAGRPRWLLADEPLASLDPAHQLDMLDRLREVAAAGAGVVVVLHDLVQAVRAADEVLLLKDGRVVAFGPAAHVIAPAPLREAFGIDVAMLPDGAGHLLPLPTGRANG